MQSKRRRRAASEPRGEPESLGRDGAITVTVPHATCPPLWEYAGLAKRENTPTGHYCDTSAPVAASLLFHELSGASAAANNAAHKFDGYDQGSDASLPLTPSRSSLHVGRREWEERGLGAGAPGRPDVAVFPSHIPRFALAPDVECDMNRATCRHTSYRDQVRDKVDYNVRKYGAQHVGLVDLHSFTPGMNAYAPHDYEIVILDPHRDPDKHEPYSDELSAYLRENGVDTAILKGLDNDITEEMRDMRLAFVFLLEFNEGLSRLRAQKVAQIIAPWLILRVSLSHRAPFSPSPVSSNLLISQVHAPSPNRNRNRKVARRDQQKRISAQSHVSPKGALRAPLDPSGGFAASYGAGT
jgi:hypothetical protein